MGWNSLDEYRQMYTFVHRHLWNSIDLCVWRFWFFTLERSLKIQSYHKWLGSHAWNAFCSLHALKCPCQIFFLTENSDSWKFWFFIFISSLSFTVPAPSLIGVRFHPNKHRKATQFHFASSLQSPSPHLIQSVYDHRFLSASFQKPFSFEIILFFCSNIQTKAGLFIWPFPMLISRILVAFIVILHFCLICSILKVCNKFLSLSFLQNAEDSSFLHMFWVSSFALWFVKLF